MKTTKSTNLLMATIVAAVLAGPAATSGAPVSGRRNPPAAMPTAAQSSNIVGDALPAGRPLTIKDIKTLVKANASDDTIISRINDTHSLFYLDASAIIKLEYAGASEKVINCMIDSTTNLVFSQPPPPPQPEDIVAAPGPDFIWIPGEWICPDGTWTWIDGGWMLPSAPNAQWVASRWQQKPDGWHRVPGRWH